VLVQNLMGRLKKTSSSSSPDMPSPDMPRDHRLAAIIESERRRESEAEMELAKSSPATHGIIQRFTKLLVDEQERAVKTVNDLRVEAQEVSIASLLRIQRLRGQRRRKIYKESAVAFDPNAEVGDAELDSTPPIRQEVLMKQARDLKSWKPRYFVLRSEGIFFWESAEAHDANPKTTSALGKIMFVDLVLPNGQAADRVPNLVSRILSQQSHVFCCHKEQTTYVLGCPSEESLKAWVKCINSAYDVFLVQQNQRNKLIEAALGVGSTELYSLATQMTHSSAKSPQVLQSLLDSLYEEFVDDVTTLTNQRTMRKVFEAWLLLTRASKRRRRKRQGSLVAL